jgi:gamma-glutamylcyclotransferase (GGCT)/AIG2-like uncharacterized protein YtfP
MTEVRDAPMIALFSYGSLRQRKVQLATYERELEGEPDVLAGYALLPVQIGDARVVELSGAAVHSIACATGNPAHRVEGVVFTLSEDELAATDAYEVEAYSRIEVTLESGRRAWAYVGPPR